MACFCLGFHKKWHRSSLTYTWCVILPCCELCYGVSCLDSFVVTSLCRIEFQDSSAFNTHPVPQAMFSAAVLILMAEIPDGLCHFLFAYVATMHF